MTESSTNKKSAHPVPPNHTDTDQPNGWCALTTPHVLIVAIVFTFVGWMIEHGFAPYAAVTTAASTLGIVSTIVVVPRSAMALGRIVRRVAVAYVAHTK